MPDIVVDSYIPPAFEFLYRPAPFKAAHGGRGSAKCFARGTRVIMFDGTLRAVEEVRVGDLLMGPDSLPRMVVELSRGIGPLWRVKQKTAIEYVVNENHILSLKKKRPNISDFGERSPAGNLRRPRGRYPNYENITNILIIAFAGQSEKFKNNFHGYKANPLSFATKSLVIPPYIFGVWIGDGCSDRQSITSADEEVIAEFAAFGRLWGCGIYRAQKRGQKASTIILTKAKGSPRTNPIKQTLKKMGVLNAKHIPADYQTSSITDRLELLAGLIDTDGTLGTGYYSFTQKSELIARQFKFVADTLGFRTSIRKQFTTAEGKRFQSFRVSVGGDIDKIPCRIPRKQVKNLSKNKDWRRTRIDVEPIGNGEFFGFSVSGDHLFLLEDGTVTHNSHSFAGALIDLGTQDAFRAVCCREIQRSIKDSSKRLLDDKIAKKNLGYGPGGAKFYYSTDSYIRGENGTLFLFEGLRGTANAVRSFEGVRYAWVDESQDVSQASLDTLLPTIREGETELWFSWNPKLPKNPVDKMFRGGEPPPGSIVREVNYPDNPFFPDSLRRLMEWDRARDPDKYQHIWLGGYERNSEARVFKNWRIASRGELRAIDGDIHSSLFTAVPRGTVPRHGADWGFAVSPTVLVRCYIVGRTLYIDRELYAVGMPIDATPDFFATMPGTRNTDGGPAWLIVADSARPETIDYVRRRGFNIVAANKGPNSIREGVEFLKSFDIVVSPDCPQTIDELSLYSFKVDKLTQAVLPELEDKKNNVIDSLRYAVEQDRKTQTRQLRINLMGR